MTQPSHDWAQALAEFLRSQPAAAAVRLDPTTRKLAVATLGEVAAPAAAALAAQLAATITAIEAQLGEEARTPRGFTLQRDGSTTQLASPTCKTAPSLWVWRDFAWPEPADAAAVGPRDGAPTVPGATAESEWKELAAFAGACGVLGLTAWGVQRAGVGPAWVPLGLYALALVAGAWDAAKDSWANLRHGKLDIHFLMLAVAVGAVAIGAWGEAVLLLFLFTASGAMEEYAVNRTNREVSALLKSAPRQARLVQPDGGEREVAIEEVGIGDIVRVRPGEAFAADGVVVKGRSASDESALTGEAQPVEKATGDAVFSGTVNLWGAVDFTVRRLPSESTLQKIIRLIHTAQQLRAPSERFTDRFGSGYTVFVLGVCAVMFLGWWRLGGLPALTNTVEQASAFYRAMTLLVVMSPCALVLSIPSAVLAAIAWGARHGVLFRGGAAVEKLARIHVVAMDKTGTLTTGELSVTTVESFPAGREAEVLELAYALEVSSEHPLARAVVRYARAQGVREREVADFSSLVGRGVRGRVEGATVLLGRRELLEAGPLATWARELPAAPADLTEVWVIGGTLVGRLLLRDQVRPESAGVLAALKAAGLRTVMLTGDRRPAAESIAREIGLDEVRAGLSPEGKVAAIQELRAGGTRRVAMVGDGVNDAPSLAAADVSVAMGARGSDAALEQAEVVLMHDRIENFLAALRLSRRARTIIAQNLTISLGVVVIMAVTTIARGVPLTLGVIAHEGSTVVVCLNSLRLLFGRNR